MLCALKSNEFEKVLPIFAGYLQDPLMYAVFEGRRPGRVFVDSPANPTFAFVWTNSECAYFVAAETPTGPGDSERLGGALRKLILEEIIPAAKAAGRDFLSLFPFPNSYAAELETLLADLLPLKTAVHTFSFNQERFQANKARPHILPPDLALNTIDRKILQDPANVYLAAEIASYWGSTDAFPRGLGHCVLEAHRAVSWCYVQAIGRGSQTIDIWTAPEHRRKGLGTAVGSAFIDHCLSEGCTPFWLCDEANHPSRRLAERLGFKHQGDIFLVDVPFSPFDFYRGLASGFFLPQEEYRQAAKSFEKAFSVQEGGAEDHYTAAVAWASAGNAERALSHLRKAIEQGWGDSALLASTRAFSPLRKAAEWAHLMDCLMSGGSEGNGPGRG